MGGERVMGNLLREKNWNDTELGPIESWDHTLVTMTSLIMTSTHPMSLWWGPNQILLYNDGYLQIAGTKHPHAFGERAREHWLELYPFLDPIIVDVMKGESMYVEDGLLVMHRHGYLEVDKTVDDIDFLRKHISPG